MSTPAAPPTLTPEQAEAQAELIAKLVYWISFTLTAFSCFYAILCWDMLNNLSVEVRRIWKTKTSLIKYLYLFNRYWAFISMTITLFMYNLHVTAAQCSKYVLVEPSIPIPLVLSYQAILITRCHAMYNESKYIIAGFAPVLLGEMAYLIYVVTQCRVLPYPAERGPCIVDGPNDVITGYFLVPLAVDVAITVVTFSKAFQLWRRNPASTVLNVFIKEGLFFFAVVFFCNLLNGVLYVQSDPFIRPIFAGGSFIICSIMTCRLVLSLRTQVDVHGNAATGSSSRSRMTNNFMMSDKRPETSVVAMPRIDDAFANDDSSFDLEGQKEPTRVNGVLVTKEIVTTI